MSQRFEAEQWIAASLPRVFAFFADPRNLPRIMPPSQGARLLTLNLVRPRFPAGETPPGAECMAGVGTEIIFKFRAIPHVPLHEKWTALITDFSLNQSFRDTQKQGPFRRWAHTHTFETKIAEGPRGHSHLRCGGVRSRLRRDWDFPGERDVPAYGALNVRVSKARSGENLSDGMAFRTCRALRAQQTMIDDAFEQKLEWPIIASIAQPGHHLSIGTGLDGGIPCTR